MFWRSVVGKLWFTILLLVAFVLFILTVLLLEFFENFHVIDAQKDMNGLATKVVKVMDDFEDPSLAQSIAWEIADPSTKIMIVKGDDSVSYSPNSELANIPLSFIKSDAVLSNVFEERKAVHKTTYIPNIQNPNASSEMIIVGIPFQDEGNGNGAVFVYQSLLLVENATKQTTNIILLGAGIAIVLTTVFAFFLSTRITSPLIKMREAAFEVAKGEFNTKVPILTHDEIGELAMAFNRMGRQLKFHINALRQEKEQLSGILRSMADGVITISRNGEILVSNPPAERFLQAWYYEQGIDSEHHEVLPREVHDLFQQVVSLEKEQVTEITIQGRSWGIVITPLYDQAYVRGAVAVIRDMTEERRLDKLREDFIANVSHELRTPISMLQGYSEAIVDGIAGTKEEQQEIAKVIYDESLRMGRLVNELLDLARMEAGHIQLNKDVVEISPYMNRIVRKFQGLVKEKNLTIRTEFSNENDRCEMDPDRIEQVLTNLIDNAIRHSNENGSVSIKVNSHDNGIKVDIKDSGSGIPETDLPFVFERFYKADKARTRGKAGTGLGLAIAKNIIEAHEGHISVHSKINEGTTFSFYIPRNHEKN